MVHLPLFFSLTDTALLIQPPRKKYAFILVLSMIKICIRNTNLNLSVAILALIAAIRVVRGAGWKGFRYASRNKLYENVSTGNCDGNEPGGTCSVHSSQASIHALIVTNTFVIHTPFLLFYTSCILTAFINSVSQSILVVVWGYLLVNPIRCRQFSLQRFLSLSSFRRLLTETSTPYELSVARLMTRVSYIESGVSASILGVTSFSTHDLTRSLPDSRSRKTIRLAVEVLLAKKHLKLEGDDVGFMLGTEENWAPDRYRIDCILDIVREAKKIALLIDGNNSGAQPTFRDCMKNSGSRLVVFFARDPPKS
ncbi:hypothetical protein CCUS01_04927 [Colletotrichum cuscutae]|uniref:Uncharacterized protein n=1 Tax=Colletotrichum cuscutae TaxID=1209917 RepID=A0AAI9Y2H9_9PEZI|nr:hypothetical protein CCUS01_04927 [Colletotrichum cuscutae]